MTFDPNQQSYGPPPGYGGYPQPQRGSNGMAIAGMVCGIVGLVLAQIILGPLALIFGGIGLQRAKRGASGQGMAIAGIVLGVIDLVLGIILAVAVAHRNIVY